MFRSFFLAGFECTTGRNRDGRWIDQIVATQHDVFADADYARLRAVGILAAREAVRWPLVEREARPARASEQRYDFASTLPLLRAAEKHGVEVLWDLFHFGYPQDADPFSRAFIERFADYCYAATRFVCRESAGPWTFTPVNEPSYLAWAGGDCGLFAPHARDRGPELKVQLARAAIAGTNAIWSACPHARIVSVDPVCRVVPPRWRPDRRAEADAFNRGAVFESFDMIAGRLHPELGGSRAHLGVVGVNYYAANQWVLGRPGVPLAPDDPRRVPLRALVREVWERYRGDVAITETSDVGERRADWLAGVAREAETLLDEGVPLRGVCLYPVLGMPEWHAPEAWTRMGLWDLVYESPTLGRVPYAPMLEALRAAQRLEARPARHAP